MQKLTLLLLLSFILTLQLSGQSINIQPYLQDVSPNSIYILWETDSGEESIVEWGVTEALGNEADGIAFVSEGMAMLHQVFIEGLERFTKYYYRVKTGNAVSEIFHFKTPPFSSDGESFRMVAMSDMQRDGAFPNKFQEIVEEGVLKYLEDEIGEDLVDNLALVMIPGDLVVTGTDFESWKNSFFNPSEKLFSHVPVYPVLGNHENNASYYFTYFKLPENGTPGFEEHWWSKDYSNVRIIGLNSNNPFANSDQLTWLDDMLASTCAVDSIDFVFAQLHHPHKSELWTPGESSFTGEVIERLEQFTTDCGKPSIHFFGHTHGYSRGQSRDHKHLWINVATAGGAIDNWGEFPNFDYDEFSVSQDEYGFVVVEVSNDDDPKLVIKRISRGDQDQIINNELTDSLTIRLLPSFVDQPQALSPKDEIEIAPECVTLVGSSFSAANSDALHGQSHWQVTTFQNGFDNPVAESWKNFENWYNELDTQSEDDLTDEEVLGLDEFTDYIWRVRYRDREMNWSEWSEVESFRTGASLALPNLLVNSGAEDDISGWVIVQGVFESLESGECDGVAPHAGTRYFSVGGLCEHSAVGRVVQNVDLSSYSDSIETGSFKVHFGGHLSNFSGSDLPEIKIMYLDENLEIISEGGTLSTLNSSWTMLNASENIPKGTRSIQLELTGTRNAGTDNDSYFDDLYLSVGTTQLDCNLTSSVWNSRPFVGSLIITPNPTRDFATIELPENIKANYLVGITNTDGRKFQPTCTSSQSEVTINVQDLPSGNYIIWLRGIQGAMYVGKLAVVD